MSSMFDNYNARLAINSEVRRETVLDRERRRLNRWLPQSLSYKSVLIDSIQQNVVITDHDNINLKTICAMPGENLKHGAIVDWENCKWLITELDAHSEIYEKGIMQQCNYLLKWRDTTGDIVEKWCIIEDGTKYIVGEHEEPKITVGDARISLIIGKDSDTVKLHRGVRFLIDDIDSAYPLAYQITKPHRLYNIYNNVGVLKFILNEVNVTQNDNVDLMVADYYEPTMNVDTDSFPDVIDYDDEKDVWL